MASKTPAKDERLTAELAVQAHDIAAASHAGNVRENNEDHYLVVRFRRSLETLATSLDQNVIHNSFDVYGYGMLVADGMGGMAAGELASSLALSTLVNLVVETPDWMMSLRREEEATIVLERMAQRFVQIDNILREQAELDSSLSGMGTTLTVAAAFGNDLIIGHIGDSRAYVLRGDTLRQLTTDHTLAQALIKAGVVSPNDPVSQSTRHVLTAALGSSGSPAEPQIHRFKLFPGDQILLCTDGLTEIVDDKTISSVLRETDSAQNACQKLIDLALAGGGFDNITTILGRFGPPLQSTEVALRLGSS